MAGASELRWQNKSIPPGSAFRGVFAMGLLAAWFYFLWQLCALPPFAASAAKLPPLLRFALAKGQYMPDFGMIVAGFVTFHVHRELRLEWQPAVARRLTLSVGLTLVAYLILAVLLLEAVSYTGPSHAFVLPWQNRLIAVQFLVVTTAAIGAIALPLFLFWMWTCIPDVCLAGIAIAFGYYGLTFTVGTHHLLWMWPLTALVDFLLGVALCSSLFRGVEYLVAVRGPAMIFGWFALLGGSIIDGPAVFFLGFVMILGCSALSERSWRLLGEDSLLLWSRTALAIILVQPAVFTAWTIWGAHLPLGGLGAGLALAVATQILATVLTLAVSQPARRLAPAQTA
jgi:hypothetical protein